MELMKAKHYERHLTTNRKRFGQPGISCQGKSFHFCLFLLSTWKTQCQICQLVTVAPHSIVIYIDIFVVSTSTYLSFRQYYDLNQVRFPYCTDDKWYKCKSYSYRLLLLTNILWLLTLILIWSSSMIQF